MPPKTGSPGAEEQGMKTGSKHLRVDWAHLALVAGIAAFCLWFWFDARSASSDVQNLLVIQPAAILALALCAVIAFGAVRAEPDAAGPESGTAARPGREWRGVLVAVLLGLYVLALVPVGFDVATFVFLAAGMYLLGERRPVFLVGYSAVFAAAMSYGFKVMLSVPVPTLLI